MSEEAQNKESKKIIAVKDYLKKRDQLVEFPVPDSNEVIAFRMKKPSANDGHRIQEYVSIKFGTTSLPSSFKDATDEQKKMMLDWSYYYSAMLVSSCFFEPDFETDNPAKIWESAEEVMETDKDIYDFCKNKVESFKIIITEGEAKK